MFNSYRGIEPATSDLNVRNVLFHRTRYAFNTAAGVNRTIHAEHITANSAEQLFNTAAGSGCILRVTNSLVCAVTNDLNDSVISNSVYNVQTSAFGPVGRGNHYLADGTYRNVGSSTVSSEMQAILRQTTTFGPVHLTNDITNDTTFSPVVQRDTDTPDLGYHYPALDYLWGDLGVTNATLILTNGVAVGHYGASGTILRAGSALFSAGLPTQLNTLVRYELVQDQPANEWAGLSSSRRALLLVSDNADPLVQLRFTRASVPADGVLRRAFINRFENTQTIRSFTTRDSLFANTYHFHQGLVYASQSGVDYFNNLFIRTALVFGQSSSTSVYPYPVWFQNNTLIKGGLSFAYTSTNTVWTFTDNVFDTVSVTGLPPGLNASYNAYLNTTSLGGTNNKTLTAVDFIPGPLGGFYYPSTGSNLADLSDAGSATAAEAGLYHFTTDPTADSKEGTSALDIGFHYVSVDGSGLAADSDSDGVPDYIEDKDGDGAIASGETNPSSYDLGLDVVITEPDSN